MNTLAQRLKFAKRELTNLKTAHKRGLGLVKNYRYLYNVPSSGHHSGFWYLTITVNFDNSFAAYPFISLIPTEGTGGEFTISVDQIGQYYKDSGYTAVIETLYIRNPTADSYSLISSSPIISISYEWNDA